MIHRLISLCVLACVFGLVLAGFNLAHHQAPFAPFYYGPLPAPVQLLLPTPTEAP